MAGQSLGLIETVGLGVAIEAADAAMKSANVDLIGYELTKGGGLVTVKLAGDVGAINAAVAAGVAVASRVGCVYAWKVIARPANGIDALIASPETTGITPKIVLSADNPPQQNSKPKVIPVVNLEPAASTGDCMVLNDEVLSTPSVNQPAAGDTKPEPSAERQEAADKPLSSEESKFPKSRHKGSKR